MLIDRTVFVIGAGASNEFGLPLGGELCAKVAQKLKFRFGPSGLSDGDFRLEEAIKHFAKQRGEDCNKYFKTCPLICDGLTLARSVDNFVNSHQGNDAVESLCKLAIFESILEAEAASGLMQNFDRDRQKLNFAALEKTWLHQFSVGMFTNVQPDKLETMFDRCTIICFNYDRCIPFYLKQAVQTYFGVDAPTAEAAVRRLKILHPYGSLGAVVGKADQSMLPFGTAHAADMSISVARLRTFCEGVEDQQLMSEIRQAMASAGRLVFLGFGYIQQNVGLLAVQDRSGLPVVLGTSVGLSTQNTRAAQDRLRGIVTHSAIGDVAELLPVVCSQFLADHNMMLFD